MDDPRIEPTADGSQTLRHALYGDAYHSLRGAVGEAGHVFIGAGLHEIFRRREGVVRVLEAGFGSGLNCWLTAVEAARAQRTVEYTAVELYPVAEKVWSALDYARDPLFCAVHRAEWGARVNISERFVLRKIEADLVSASFDDIFDLIYMDAFAPDTQPEMWSVDVLGKLCASTSGGGLLVTYCAKGVVKRTLRSVGYRVERLPGAMGKRHMLRGVKI